MAKRKQKIRDDSELVELVKEVLGDYSALRSHFIWALVEIRKGNDPFVDYDGSIPKEDYIRTKSRYVRERLGLMVFNKLIRLAPTQREYGDSIYNFNVYQLNAKDTPRVEGHSRNRSLSHKIAENEYLADVEIGCFLNPNLKFIPSWEVALRFSEKARKSRNPFSIPAPIIFDGYSTTINAVPDKMFVIEYKKGSKKEWRGFLLEANQATEDTNLYTKKKLPPSQRVKRKGYKRELLVYQSIAKGLYKSHWNLPTMLMITLAISNRHKKNLQSVNEALSLGKGFSWALYDTMPKFGKLPPAFPTGETVDKPLERVGHEPFIMSAI